MEEQFKNLIIKYVDVLKENIEKRFEGNFKVLIVFRVFDLIVVFKKIEVGFKQYGIVDVVLLGDFLY